MSESIGDCPFCGDPGRKATELRGNESTVKEWFGCFSCGIQAHSLEDWNRRPAKPQTAAVLAEVVEQVSKPGARDYETAIVIVRDLEAFKKEQGVS